MSKVQLHKFYESSGCGIRQTPVANYSSLHKKKGGYVGRYDRQVNRIELHGYLFYSMKGMKAVYIVDSIKSHAIKMLVRSSKYRGSLNP